VNGDSDRDEVEELDEEQRSEEPGPADDGPAWMDAPTTGDDEPPRPANQ
jgi:hypothetical protein